MASCRTSIWASNAPSVRLTVNISSQNDTTATLSWQLDLITTYSGFKATTARSYSVKIDGSTVKSGTYKFSGGVGTYSIASGTKTITKGTSPKSVSFSCSFAFNYTWGGVYKGTLSASGSISVGAKTKYTITYNANGGSGAPGSQTKWHGTTLKLSSTKPTRTGYTFQGWGTSASDTTPDWQPGGNYTANASDTLYAIWKANTYAVKYNANGGSGAPAQQTKTYGQTLKLSTTKPTRTNYNFLGWGTSASTTKVSYAAGANYTANAAITLYAVWELAYIKPRITNLSVTRCNSSGSASDDGTYALVKFNWATDKTVTLVKIERKASSGDPDSYTVNATGTSGSVSQIVGGELNIDFAFLFTITVKDTETTTSTARITGKKYVIDFKAGGNGVAIGKSAELDDRFEVSLPSRYRNSLIVGPADEWDEALGGVKISANGSIYIQRSDAATESPLLTFRKYGTSSGYDFRFLYNAVEDYMNCQGAPLVLDSDKYLADGHYALDMRNSDMVGVNTLFFADETGASEGLAFPKSSVNPPNNMNTYTYNSSDWMFFGAIGTGELRFMNNRVATYDGTYKIGKTIWSGSAGTNSSMSIPDINEYWIYRINMEGQGTTVLGIRNGSYIRGIGGYTTATPTITHYYFSGEISGTTVKVIECGSGKPNLTSITKLKVTSVTGLI